MKRYLRYLIPAALVALIGLIVALLLILPGEESENPDAPSDSAEPETPSVEAETAKHKLHDYFLLENDAEAISFSSILQYEGDEVARDEAHGLLALATEDLDFENQVTRTVRVYDLSAESVIHETSVTYPLESEEKIDLTVEIEYPILRVKKSFLEGGEPRSEISYYFAKKGSDMICSTTKEDGFHDHVNRFGNGLSAFLMAGDVYWIDRNMEIVRSVSVIASNGYDVGETAFASEYYGYLYAFGDQRVQIFNRLGICSGEYRIAHDGILRSFVLDNGNVLIQDYEVVDMYETYDVILDNVRYAVRSYVMNLVDGALTPVSINYLVETLETSYLQENAAWNREESALPFALAQGRQNQAIIYRYAAGAVSLYQEYVVMTNDLAVEYAVENKRLGLDFSTARVIQSDLYSAEVYEGGARQRYLFDLDGNALTPITNSDFFVSDTYIVTEFGVYTHRMEKILDLRERSLDLLGVDTENDRVYIGKHNFAEHANELYVLTPASSDPQLLSDGTEQEYFDFGLGYYVLYDKETNQYSFLNLAGEVKLVVWNIEANAKGFEKHMKDGILVRTEFEDRTVYFSVR